MKFNHKPFLLALVVLAGLSTSCKDEDVLLNSGTPNPPTPPTPTYSVKGQWLQETTSGGVQVMATDNYKEDGTFDSWIYFAGDQYTYSGTYTYSDNKLTRRYVSPITNSNTVEVYIVNKLDKYSMSSTLDAVQASENFYRIVNTYQMNVGDSRAFSVDDADFAATAYSSTNPQVATVDATGKIQAVKRGFAFIKASTASSTAAIRVEVADASHPVDDLMPFMGGSIENVKAAFGDNYTEIPGELLTEWRYDVIDNVIKSVSFSHLMGNVMTATISLRDEADFNAIAQYLDEHYTLKQSNSAFRQYSTEVGDERYAIMLSLSQKLITFMRDFSNPDPEQKTFPDEAYQQFDGLILQKINDAASALNYELTEEDWENGFTELISIDNPIFASLSLIFDEDEDSDEYMEVGTVTLDCKNGIKQEDIEGWYKEHYEATGDELNPYYRGGDKPYWVSFRQSGSRLEVLYKTSKRKK